MTYNDIATLHRILGMMEVVAMGVPKEQQGLMLDECEIFSNILDREMKELAERGEKNVK